MSIITAGIDLAKNILAVHGVNEHGKGHPRDMVANEVDALLSHLAVISLTRRRGLNCGFKVRRPASA